MSDSKPKTTMQISVQNAKGEHTYFKVKSSTTLGKVMNAYAKKLNLDPQMLRFLCDGIRVMKDDTPESLELEEADFIQAFLEQDGGNNFI